MTTSVCGIKPPDDRFQQMLSVWKACEKAGIRPPREVQQFFDDRDPDVAGVVITTLGAAIKAYKADGQEGFEVDLRLLPKDVKILRFVNSW